MKLIAFGANFLWVLILGLLGPALPGIIRDLNIDYARGGLFFSVISFGGLFGTTAGSILSDFVSRKLIFLVSCGFLVVSLLFMSGATSFLFFMLALLLLSVVGSPIGAVGQGMVLHEYPESRETNLTIQSIFAGLGSFVAPLMISLSYLIGMNWRFAFVGAAVIGGALFIGMLIVRLPATLSGGEANGKEKRNKSGEGGAFSRTLLILKNRDVLLSFILMFLFVGVDFGFSYWLAEYSKTELSLSIKLSSGVVLFYIGGVILGRLVGLYLLKRLALESIVTRIPIISLIAFVGFLIIDNIYIKLLCIVLYGFGVSPLFPLIMAYGTRAIPDNPGIVTGLLFASLSFGGIVFPFLIGIIALRFSLGSAFIFILFILIVIIITMWVAIRVRRE